MATLTDKTITKALREAKANGRDIWLTDQTKARGVGRLRLRARPGGVGVWYFRYSDPNGKQDQLSLGVYDSADVAGLGLKSARAKAGELSQLYQAGKRNLRGYLEHREAEETRRIEAARREEARAKSGSLKALLNGYVHHLERQGKRSAGDVANTVRLHVFEAFPELSSQRATDISHRDISAVLSKLIENGKGRTAGKLRSHLAAAFSAAIQAEGDPTIPTVLHGFGLETNPAALVPAKSLSRFNRARERTLNESELRAFMKALEPSLHSDALMLSLLLGGQRPAQLLRVRPADVDLDGGTIILYDGKGARQHPRAHILPLAGRAVEIVERHFDAGRAYLLSNTGKVPVRTETLSKLVNETSATMVKAGTAREPFQLRDLRRTCETMLAAMGVSRDIRAQLLSHGLGGVQVRHYDRHEYMAEKRQALEAWDRKLKQIREGKKDNVVPFVGAPL